MKRSMSITAAENARCARCVESCRAWNERVRAGGDPDPPPLIGTALTAGFRWLQISCPDCRTVGEVDLASLDRHPEASISSLVPSLSCKGCPNSKFMPRLVALSVVPTRERAAR
jgi:hypothetical protein